MNKETYDKLNYKAEDIKENIKALGHSEITEEIEAVIKNDLLKQIDELRTELVSIIEK